MKNKNINSKSHEGKSESKVITTIYYLNIIFKYPVFNNQEKIMTYAKKQKDIIIYSRMSQ